jgi:hypothetical protein
MRVRVCVRVNGVYEGARVRVCGYKGERVCVRVRL